MATESTTAETVARRPAPIFAQVVEMRPVFGAAGHGEYPFVLPGTIVISGAHLRRLGTMRQWGRRGAGMVAELENGMLVQITRAANERFARAVRKVLPRNSATPSVPLTTRLEWADPADWTIAVDAYSYGA